MKRDAISILLLFGLCAVFAREVILYGASPYSGDILVQFYPWKAYVQAMLAQGEIPYWNPFTHAGAPLLANLQSAVFYPFDLIVLLLPLERFFGLSLLLHLWIAGAGVYALARVCGASPPPALLAGLAYALNGFTMIHIPFGNHLTYAGAAWAPWLFFVTAGFMLRKGERLAWAAGVAGVGFLHFTCGHPQMFFYSSFFCLAFALGLRVWIARREGRPAIRAPLGWTILWGLALSLGVLMASVQLFATLDYFPLANRAATLDVDAATEFSFAPHRLPALLAPEFFGTHLRGNHWDEFYYWSCAYAGVSIPILALLLFRRGVRPTAAVPLLAVAAVGLFFAWGRGNPFYEMIALQLPGFGHFRAPAKYLPYYLVPLCALAALGLERLCGEAYAARANCACSRSSAMMRVAALGLFLLAALLAFGPLLDSAYDVVRSTPQVIYVAVNASLIALGLIAANGVAFLLARRVPRHPRLAISASLVLILCVDLFAFGREYFLVTLRTPQQIRTMNVMPPSLRFIQHREDYAPMDRVSTLYDIPDPNRFMLWDQPNLAGYDPLALREYMRAMARMEGWPPERYHDNVQLTALDHEVLDALNVRYIVAGREIEDRRLERVFSDQRFVAYERLGENRAWAWIAPAEFDPAAEEVEWSPLREGFTMETYEPHRIAFTVETDRPVWLRAAEWNYPRWRAWLRRDGEPARPAPLTPDAHGLRTLALEPGAWTVEMRYVEPWGRWLLTALAWVVFAKLGWIAWLLKTGRFWPILQRLMGRYY